MFLYIFCACVKFHAESLQHTIYFGGFSAQYSYTALLCRLIADVLQAFSRTLNRATRKTSNTYMKRKGRKPPVFA